jgi:hypothetical protein
MTEQSPQEPKKKSKGIPTWIWFIGTFAVVSLAGNVVFGGNTWINTSANFITNSVNSLFPERDTSKDDFCLTGAVSEIDRTNLTAVISEAEALVGTTTGAIGYASLSDDPDQLAEAIGTVRESGPQYAVIGERLLTAQDCGDATFEYLMQDFGGSLVEMSKNFSEWDPETLTTNPVLLITVTPLIESAATKARAIITYAETLK